MKTTILQATELLRKASNVALFCHIQPDGDTFGATVALWLGLTKQGKKVNIFCDDELGNLLPKYSFGAEINRTFFGEYDLLVAVDCGDIFRLGSFSGLFDKANNSLVIDHHMGEPYGKYFCAYEYASTCQIAYQILLGLGVELDTKIATSLYVGLCTDTGNFAHANTTSEVFEVAKQLSLYNVDIPVINRDFFKSMSFLKAKLVGRALSSMRTYYSDKLCIIFVRQSDLAQFGLTPEASKNLVDYAVNIDTALVGVAVAERKENVFNISMRGKDIDVRSICERFGGGGHKLASGCIISGFFEDVIDKIVRTVGDRLVEDGIEI